MKFREYLNEVLNTVLEYDQENPGEYIIKGLPEYVRLSMIKIDLYKNDRDGRVQDLGLSYAPDLRDPIVDELYLNLQDHHQVIAVEFTVGGDYEKTSEHKDFSPQEVLALFGTVVHITKEYIKKYKPGAIMWAGKTDDRSRLKMYERWAKQMKGYKFLTALNYSEGDRVWYLFKK